MATDKYLQLAQKLRNSMLDGEPNAESILRKLMQKHGITEEQLNDAHKRFYCFKYHIKEAQLILFQVIAKVMNHDDIYSGRSNTFSVECTKAEAAEIQIMYDFYYEKFLEQIDILRTAFIIKNKILAPFQMEDLASGENKKAKKTAKSRSIEKMMKLVEESEYQKQLQ
jgi:hypothetical protein